MHCIILHSFPEKWKGVKSFGTWDVVANSLAKTDEGVTTLCIESSDNNIMSLIFQMVQNDIFLNCIKPYLDRTMCQLIIYFSPLQLKVVVLVSPMVA